jgi:UTP--glucose-1-phosphate uridylyltransferase
MTGIVTKAVIPAAGLGTRFLPATKAQPKEMLPLVDKPAIQHVVEEAVRAGIGDLLIVTGRNKQSIEDHFDRSLELEQSLSRSGKAELLDLVRGIADLVDMTYVRQGVAAGLGHAVGCAKRHVGDNPFAVLLPDDVMHPESTLLTDMIAAYEQTEDAVIALMEVSATQISSYGCAAIRPGKGDLVKITEIVEKPPVDDAPSNLAVMGRYIFSPEIFSILEHTKPGVGGEIQLTDAIAELAAQDRVTGVVFSSGRYDVGNKIDFLRATVELAWEHEELGPEFSQFLEHFVKIKGEID